MAQPMGQISSVDNSTSTDTDINAESHTIPAVDLPDPDRLAYLTEVIDLPRHPPRREPTAKGIIGAAVRTLKNIPPCVWVVNHHSEEITVVVSKYKPDRLLTGLGLTASPTAVGLSFETTAFVGPASRKTLAARDQGRERSTAVFPLWTRQDGFGVISIYKGAEQILYIENDRVPLGATVHFEDKPDLRIVKHK